MNQSVSRGSVGQSADCNPHPDAPHGFDRTASLNEDRYVCDCESWSEKYADRIPRESDLRTRIAAALSGDLCRQQHAIDPDRDWQWFNMDALADAVIRELDTVLVDFGLWLAEEITGRTMTRIDLESCLEDWKGGGADE